MVFIMAAKKRTKIQYERDLEKTADLYCQGWTQLAIAKEIGVSQSQISLDLKEVQTRWRERSILNIDDWKAEELAKVDRIEAELWIAWHDSRRPTQVKNAQKTTAGRYPGKTVSQKETSSAGDPRFMFGILECIEKRCRILGLHAPTKLQGTFTHDHEYTDKEIQDIAAHLAGRKN
jgi:hypothetical protein